MKHIMQQISYCVKSVISSFFCLSSCKFPNHLCHLLDMPKSNIPVWYCSKNITHIVLSHIHVPTYLASFQKGKPFQNQTTEIYPGLWPFSPTAHLGFHRNRCVPWEVNEMTRLQLMPLITSQVYSIWLVHQQKHKSGQQHKTLASEMCDCPLIILLGTALPYQLGPCSSVSWEWEQECKLCLGEKRVRQKGPERIPETTSSKW